jgi:hypothetical protein
VFYLLMDYCMFVKFVLYTSVRSSESAVVL